LKVGHVKSLATVYQKNRKVYEIKALEWTFIHATQKLLSDQVCEALEEFLVDNLSVFEKRKCVNEIRESLCDFR